MDIYKTQRLILKKIVEEVKKDSVLKNNVINIALLGSFSTKEAVENYSDLDILFIIKSDCFGMIYPEVVSNLKKIVEKVGKYGIEISFLSHTIFEFQNYVDANYLIHYSWGKVFYGNKNNFAGIFNKILKTKRFNDAERKKLIKYDIPHTRFNLIRKYVSWKDFSETGLKKLLKLYIDGAIEICEWVLVFKGIFLKRKQDILKRFLLECGDYRDANFLVSILKIRKDAMSVKLNKDDAEVVIGKIINLINYCNRKIYE